MNAVRLSCVSLVVGLVAVAASCGGTTNQETPGGAHDAGVGVDGAPPVTGSLPCDVDSVLARNCRTCHSSPTQYAAPMPLVTFADLHATAPADPNTTGSSLPVYQAVGQRIHDDAKPMPQPPNPRLNAADTATLDNWIAAGAPSGSATCTTADAGSNDSGVVVPLACTPDEHLAPPSPWAMPQTTDDVYVCYGIELNLTAARQVIGMAARVDNHTIVHHMLLFQADTAVSPTPAPCSLGGSQNWKIVYGWAPGSQPFNMPPTVGFGEDSTTHYVVQIHYNNINHVAGQMDTSGFDLCSTDQLRPNVADVMAFGTMSFTIPPHGSLDITCSLQQTFPLGTLHLFSSSPHMHQIGTAISTTLYPGGNGAPVDLGTQLNWSFQNQSWSLINATLNQGDTVKTRCAWSNPSANPVSFGPYTEDEMCYSFTMYYPKIQFSQWSWAAPAALSTCVPTSPADGGQGD